MRGLFSHSAEFLGWSHTRNLSCFPFLLHCIGANFGQNSYLSCADPPGTETTTQMYLRGLPHASVLPLTARGRTHRRAQPGRAGSRHHEPAVPVRAIEYKSLLQELAELELPDLKRWIKQHPDTISWEFKKWVGEQDHGRDAELADRVGLSIVQLEAEAEVVEEHGLIADLETESHGPATVPKGLALSANGLRALRQQAALFEEQLGVSRARSLMEVMSGSTKRQVEISTDAADATERILDVLLEEKDRKSRCALVKEACTPAVGEVPEEDDVEMLSTTPVLLLQAVCGRQAEHSSMGGSSDDQEAVCLHELRDDIVRIWSTSTLEEKQQEGASLSTQD